MSACVTPSVRCCRGLILRFLPCRDVLWLYRRVLVILDTCVRVWVHVCNNEACVPPSVRRCRRLILRFLLSWDILRLYRRAYYHGFMCA